MTMYLLIGFAEDAGEYFDKIISATTGAPSLFLFLFHENFVQMGLWIALEWRRSSCRRERQSLSQNVVFFPRSRLEWQV